MTYCVGMKLDSGLVFMSDTRTNAGLDNIATYKKMYDWVVPDERVITLLSSGNLATTQSVVSQLQEQTRSAPAKSSTILNVSSMFKVAEIIGRALRRVIQDNAVGGPSASSSFNASFILGGQIRDEAPSLFLIYPEGNFIEAGSSAPYLQIGEIKYGRPILVRGFDSTLSFAEALRLLLVSFDSTIKANLTVGLPLHYYCYSNDSFHQGQTGQIRFDDEYFKHISETWGASLKSALEALPGFPLE